MLEYSFIKLMFFFVFFVTLCVANRESRAELEGREKKTVSEKETRVRQLTVYMII